MKSQLALKVRTYGWSGLMMIGAMGASMDASAQDSPCVGVGPASWIADMPTSAQPLPHHDAENAGDDELIWDNGDYGISHGSPYSQLDTAYPFDCGAADDILLREQNPNAWYSMKLFPALQGQDIIFKVPLMLL